MLNIVSEILPGSLTMNIVDVIGRMGKNSQSYTNLNASTEQCDGLNKHRVYIPMS